MKIFNYSKLVYKAKTPEKPKVAPRAGIDKKLEERRRKQEQLLKLKKTAAQRHRSNKTELLKYWKENNKDSKIEAVKDDPKAIALYEIKDPRRAKEAYLLMSLIEKYWPDQGGINKALELYRRGKSQAKRPRVINFTVFEHFFRKGKHPGNATDRLGFYFWKSKGKWYTYDMNKGSDDESCDSGFLVKSISKINFEFNETAHKDSGLTVDTEQQILKLLKGGLKTAGLMISEKYSSTRGKKVIEYFKKNAKDKWISPDEKTAALMNVILGRGVGKFLYRYTKDRIYFVQLQGADIPSGWAKEGYIPIKNGKLGKWSGESGALKKYLIDKMPAKNVQDEVLQERTKRGVKVAVLDQLKQTAGMATRIFKIRKVEYNRLEIDYLSKLKTKLIAELVKKGISRDKAENIAALRIKDIETKIKAKIDANKALSKAVKENIKTKLEIIVNEKDEVSVDFGKIAEKTKYQKLLSKGKKAVNTVASRVKDTMSRIEAIVKRKFKRGAPIVMWLLNSVAKIPDGLKKMFSGKSAPVTTMVLGFLGIKVSKDILSSKKLRQDEFDKLIPKGKKEYVFKKKRYLPGPIQLKKRKIIIPKGSGIKISEKLDKKYVRVDGNPVTLDPKAQKGAKKKGFMGLFGGKKDVALFKKSEIVILDGATIPKGTIIPKGTKVKVT